MATKVYEFWPDSEYWVDCSRQDFEDWIDALSSEKIPQVTGKLRKGNGRCCLGVLVDIAFTWELGDEDYGCSAKEVFDQEAIEPPLMSFCMSERLAEMNDGGESFMDIAATLRQAYNAGVIELLQEE